MRTLHLDRLSEASRFKCLFGFEPARGGRHLAVLLLRGRAPMSTPESYRHPLGFENVPVPSLAPR